MIMQEPNLFTGTFKQNLDPFSFYDDQTIIHLSDGGKNLSEGER